MTEIFVRPTAFHFQLQGHHDTTALSGRPTGMMLSFEPLTERDLKTFLEPRVPDEIESERNPIKPGPPQQPAFVQPEEGDVTMITAEAMREYQPDLSPDPAGYVRPIEYADRLILPIKFALSMLDGRNLPVVPPIQLVVPYYRSSGQNSGMPTFWFPIYCIQEATRNPRHCGTSPPYDNEGYFSKFIGQNIGFKIDSENPVRVTSTEPSAESETFAYYLQKSLASTLRENPTYMEEHRRLGAGGQGHLTTVGRFINFLGYLVNRYFFMTREDVNNPFYRAFIQIHDRLLQYIGNYKILREGATLEGALDYPLTPSMVPSYPKSFTLIVHDPIRLTPSRRVATPREVNSYLDQFDIASKCINKCLVNYWSYASKFYASISKYIICYYVYTTRQKDPAQATGELNILIDDLIALMGAYATDRHNVDCRHRSLCQQVGWGNSHPRKSFPVVDAHGGGRNASKTNAWML